MPSLEWNNFTWEKDYHWNDEGEEWSQPWGNSQWQWQYSIFPRISSFLPAERILEIAPGFGRWTKYLQHYCKAMIAIDASTKCIDHCTDKFKDASHLQLFTNDGKSLDVVEDCSVDFVFSFDSLVHADVSVIQEYMKQLKNKIRQDGVIFLHH